LREEKLLKLLKALLKNSRRSDRELARTIGASQPTVTRNRKILAEYIRSYTIMPSFDKIGYEILAFTFSKLAIYDKDQVNGKLEQIKEWVMKRPNVIFSSDGEGLGKDAVMISLHRSYSKYVEFMKGYSSVSADFATDMQSFIVSLKTGIMLKPLDLTYLADDIQELDKETS
jgi:DNA-binding Lrp family transcriptional regulator